MAPSLSPTGFWCNAGSQVRNGLSGGGRAIRTLGPLARRSGLLREGNWMRESVHLGATRDQQPRCYLREGGGRRMLTRSEEGEWGYARPNICDPMAHWIGATARAAKGVQNLRSSKLPRNACGKVGRAPRYRRPAAVAGLWARGSTLDFDTAHPRRCAAAPGPRPPLSRFRRARRHRDHRRFLWDRFFLARTSCGGNDRRFR